MGLIYHDHKIIREIVHKSGVIPPAAVHSDAWNNSQYRSKIRLTQHFHIKMGSLCDPLCFDQFISLLKYLTRSFNSASIPVMARSILSGAHHNEMPEKPPYAQIDQRAPRSEHPFLYSVHFISKKFYPDCSVRSRRREDLHISTNPECTAGNPYHFFVY